MLLDPLQCSGNADRIVHVWEPLVKQFQRAERRNKTPARGLQSGSKGKGGRGRAGRGGDSAAAAPAVDAGGRNRNQAQARRVTRRAAAQWMVSMSAHRLHFGLLHCSCLSGIFPGPGKTQLGS